ncbi:hypothetical protein, partial [Burkholderia sp. SIMBA_062]|uniref:hypothetical protein n=1 Tax=Burkholderia sp. SIMBA_062 TaxID=3085803 RepID=UPI00397A3882
RTEVNMALSIAPGIHTTSGARHSSKLACRLAYRVELAQPPFHLEHLNPAALGAYIRSIRAFEHQPGKDLI